MFFFNNIFSSSVKFKDHFDFTHTDIDKIISDNRTMLGRIDNWIDEEAFKKSFFNYGVPDFIAEGINKKINNDVTYTDLIVYLCNQYFSTINYLEIGVSVGKNFYQIINSLNTAKFTGFDIEEINPVLERQMDLKSSDYWNTPNNSIKKTRSSIKKYHYNDKEVAYINGDVWDEKSWSMLEGNKYNVVFSDALHSPKAILFEFEMLVKYNLLAEKFIIVWDDLVGKMKNSFFRIIKKYNKEFSIQEVYLLNINGWIGEHEKPHSVGLVSNFSFK